MAVMHQRCGIAIGTETNEDAIRRSRSFADCAHPRARIVANAGSLPPGPSRRNRAFRPVPASPYMAFIFFGRRIAIDFQRASSPFLSCIDKRMAATSMRVRSPGYEDWSGAAGGAELDAAPSDCDCGDTIRELLAEVAGTAMVFFLIMSIVRALQ
jgi:hypothetical protein